MEISPSPAATYLPPQISESRVARREMREIPVTRESAAGQNKEDRTALPSSYPATESENNSNTRRTAATNQAQVGANSASERENQAEIRSADTQRLQAQQAAAHAGGKIKLDIEDGNRVLQVYDSKDILIYQLPPKGALMLIKAQENAQQPQVQTSA
jgi:uncharacterized FlaG/YvyC family protein